ncbi:hypothetical protein IWX47DRAFT_83313 [Phyllosticta citricarpa]
MVICGDGQDDVEMILAASGHINGDFWFYFFIFCFLFSPDYYLVELPGLQQGRGVALSHRRSRRRVAQGVRYVGTNTCHRPTPRGFFPSQPNAFAQSEDGDDQAKPQTPSPFTSRPISQLTKELSLKCCSSFETIGLVSHATRADSSPDFRLPFDPRITVRVIQRGCDMLQRCREHTFSKSCCVLQPQQALR